MSAIMQKFSSKSSAIHGVVQLMVERNEGSMPRHPKWIELSHLFFKIRLPLLRKILTVCSSLAPHHEGKRKMLQDGLPHTCGSSANLLVFLNQAKKTLNRLNFFDSDRVTGKFERCEVYNDREKTNLIKEVCFHV